MLFKNAIKILEIFEQFNCPGVMYEHQLFTQFKVENIAEEVLTAFLNRVTMNTDEIGNRGLKKK